MATQKNALHAFCACSHKTGEPTILMLKLTLKCMIFTLVLILLLISVPTPILNSTAYANACANTAAKTR